MFVAMNPQLTRIIHCRPTFDRVWFSFCTLKSDFSQLPGLYLMHMNTNPIYIVDDDKDDEDLIKEAFTELGITNEVRFFSTAEGVLYELNNSPDIPFVIISDINLPRM